MKNTVEEANNFRDAGAPSSMAARQAKDDRAGSGMEALSARYSVLKQIGESFNTRLYLARENHSQSANLVILKVLHHDVVKDPTELVSFLLEARAAARLSHDNIIKARGAEQIGSTHFYVLEHKAGTQTLRERLNQKGWLDIDQAIRLANQLADALKYAHESGVLHLEIEPDKVLVDADGGATLTGFGVDARKQFEWAHRKRSSKCSFNYLSPEQLDHGLVDRRSDLYSMGVTLYEALTDRLPFNAESAEQMKRRIATQKPQPPHLLRSDIPAALSGIVTRLISKNPAERFQDAASLQYALGELLNPAPRQPARAEQPSREPLRQAAVEQESAQDEFDYTHTRELASEPARSARIKNAALSRQSQVSDAGVEKKEVEKKEADQPARYEPAPAPMTAVAPEEIDAAAPKQQQQERIGGENPTPLIKTFDAAATPAPVRLALFSAILIAVIGISVMAYRERFANKAGAAQPNGLSNVNAVEARGPAPDESKPSKPEENNAINDAQPDAARQHTINSGVSNATSSSRGSGAGARPWTNGARLSAGGQPRKNYQRSQKVSRRGSGGKARVWGRNAYRRH
ncbi:MAG: serine/threonine protein kinase [Blastocatellia bacterium]